MLMSLIDTIVSSLTTKDTSLKDFIFNHGFNAHKKLYIYGFTTSMVSLDGFFLSLGTCYGRQLGRNTRFWYLSLMHKPPLKHMMTYSGRLDA